MRDKSDHNWRDTLPMTTPAKSPAEKRADEMTDEELRIAIAQWCGRKADYTRDLNAMWQAEETLKPQRNAVESTPWGKYFLLGLLRFAERENLPVGHLTAKHKAIVFVDTIQRL